MGRAEAAKAGAVELDTSKQSSKKPKFSKKWAEVQGGAEPQFAWYKSQKAAAKGSADGSVGLRDDTKLPGALQARGEYSFEMAADGEAARDFMRAFNSGRDILLRGSDPDAAAAPVPVPVTKTGGSVNADVVAAVAEEFGASVLAQALAEAGIFRSPAQLRALTARVIGNLTVGAAMDALTKHGCLPAMFQNKYVVVVSGASSRPESVRVLTYGFVGDTSTRPLGDRPDMKYTPFVLRLLTENLLDRSEAERSVAMSYSVSSSRLADISDEMARDTDRLRYAVRTGDYEHLLELEVVSAAVAGEDGKGVLFSIDTPARQLLLRVGTTHRAAPVDSGPRHLVDNSAPSF